MHVSKRRAIAVLSAATLAGSAVTGTAAFGHDGGSGSNDHQGGAADHHGAPGRDDHDRGLPLLKTTLAPSIPTDPALHGVPPGGLPWALRRGEARLGGDGAIDVRVRGLVIPVAPGNGTPGPVITISAALYCGNDTTAAASTAAVPISRSGDAVIHATVSLPTTCLAPVVLVNPNGSHAAYIAASGFTG